MWDLCLGTEILVQLNLDISKTDYSNNIYISKLFGRTCINHSFFMNCNLCFLNVWLNLQSFFSGFYEVQDKDFWVYLKYFSNVIDIYSMKKMKPNNILWICPCASNFCNLILKSTKNWYRILMKPVILEWLLWTF